MKKVIYWFLVAIFAILFIIVILSIFSKEKRECIITTSINNWHFQISGDFKDSLKFESIIKFLKSEYAKFKKEQEKLNIFGENEYVPVSKDFLFLMKKSLRVAHLTNGYYDPTYYVFLKLWGFETKNYKLPNYGEIELVSKNVDFNKIDIQGNTIKLGLGQKITIEDILKPYLVLKAWDKYKKLKMILELDEIFVNTKNKKFGIKNPENPSQFLGEIVLKNDEMVVSLNPFYNFFGIGKDLYHYIINPKTGYPANGELMGVILVGNDCTLLALAKALYCMGLDKAIDFMKKNSVKGILIYKLKGKVRIFLNGDLEFHSKEKGK